MQQPIRTIAKISYQSRFFSVAADHLLVAAITSARLSKPGSSGSASMPLTSSICLRVASHHAMSASAGQTQACSQSSAPTMLSRVVEDGVGHPRVAPTDRQRPRRPLVGGAGASRTPRSCMSGTWLSDPHRAYSCHHASSAETPTPAGRSSHDASPTGTRCSVASVSRNESWARRWTTGPASCSQPRVAYDVSDGVWPTIRGITRNLEPIHARSGS